MTTYSLASIVKDNRTMVKVNKIMAVVLYGLGPAQLHGRLVLGWYRQQTSAGQSLAPATTWSPRAMLSVSVNTIIYKYFVMTFCR